jgi:CxC4 like cysteine cluster associated with KDZ transposases
MYTTQEAFVVDIELQVCPRCPAASRKFIGPDPRNIGLFNYNNRRLFTHELFTEYISAFTSSETPIDPWVEHITRRYQETAHQEMDSIPFIGGELFRVAWFSFVRLMTLQPEHPNFKACPLCKEMPTNVIWDGVSIAFGRKQVNDNLRPPTSIDCNPVRRPSRPCPNKEWLGDGARRKQLREWLGSGLDSKVPAGDKNERKMIENALARQNQFHDLKSWLATEDTHLGKLFERTLGFSVLHSDFSWKPRVQHLKLFQLVRKCFLVWICIKLIDAS